MNFDHSIRRYSVGHGFALRIGVLASTALALAGCGGGGENSDGTRLAEGGNDYENFIVVGTLSISL
jgi:hypothetical protein